MAAARSQPAEVTACRSALETAAATTARATCCTGHRHRARRRVARVRSLHWRSRARRPPAQAPPRPREAGQGRRERLERCTPRQAALLRAADHHAAGVVRDRAAGTAREPGGEAGASCGATLCRSSHRHDDRQPAPGLRPRPVRLQNGGATALGLTTSRHLSRR